MFIHVSWCDMNQPFLQIRLAPSHSVIAHCKCSWYHSHSSSSHCRIKPLFWLHNDSPGEEIGTVGWALQKFVKNTPFVCFHFQQQHSVALFQFHWFARFRKISRSSCITGLTTKMYRAILYSKVAVVSSRGYASF